MKKLLISLLLLLGLPLAQSFGGERAGIKDDLSLTQRCDLEEYMDCCFGCINSIFSYCFHFCKEEEEEERETLLYPQSPTYYTSKNSAYDNSDQEEK